MEITPELEWALQRSVDEFVREQIATRVAECKQELRDVWPEFFGHMDDAALAAADLGDMLDRRDWELGYGTGFTVPRGIVSADPAKQREVEQRRKREEVEKVEAWERRQSSTRV